MFLATLSHFHYKPSELVSQRLRTFKALPPLGQHCGERRNTGGEISYPCAITPEVPKSSSVFVHFPPAHCKFGIWHASP